jgi:hypothetical protein
MLSATYAGSETHIKPVAVLMVHQLGLAEDQGSVNVRFCHVDRSETSQNVNDGRSAPDHCGSRHGDRAA